MTELRWVLNLTVLGLGCAILGACQTDRLQEISSIENGMSKANVLGIAGGPQRSERKGGEDQWIYIVPEERRDILKEVRFRDGRVSYVGDVIPPKGPIAAEQDRINEASNAKSEAERRREQLLEEISPKGHSNGATYAPSSTTSAFSASATADDEQPPSKPAPKANFVPLEGSGQ